MKSLAILLLCPVLVFAAEKSEPEKQPQSQPQTQTAPAKEEAKKAEEPKEDPNKIDDFVVIEENRGPKNEKTVETSVGAQEQSQRRYEVYTSVKQNLLDEKARQDEANQKAESDRQKSEEKQEKQKAENKKKASESQTTESEKPPL